MSKLNLLQNKKINYVKNIALIIKLLFFLLCVQTLFSQSSSNPPETYCFDSDTCSTIITNLTKIIEIKKNINGNEVFCTLKLDFKIKKCGNTIFIELVGLQFNSQCNYILFFNMPNNTNIWNILNTIKTELIINNILDLQDNSNLIIKYYEPNCWKWANNINTTLPYIKYYERCLNDCCLTIFEVDIFCNKITVEDSFSEGSQSNCANCPNTIYEHCPINYPH